MDAPVVTAVARDEELETELYAVERRAVHDAVPARRREFRTGRACARRCLERLGRPPGPIGCGPRGEPLWPTGVVGSITHCAGLRACAVAPAAAVRALGIDAEPNAPLPDGVAEVIATAA
jgi:4'-phosphopantetheinyl transferase EntD